MQRIVFSTNNLSQPYFIAEKFFSFAFGTNTDRAIENLANRGDSMQKKKILNNKGQGVMEYVILSSLIGIFCLTMVAQYGDVLKKRIDYMKQSLSQNLERDIYNLDN